MKRCAIPSQLLGLCDLEWGHDDAMHVSEGDGFYARAYEAEHQRRQNQRKRKAMSRMTKRKATPRNLPRIFENILAMDKESKVIFIEAFNKLLDELRDDDFFGTEGQNDPRGDGRD